MANGKQVPPERVKELADKCGLPAAKCRATLEAHGGDVDAALTALIQSRQVKLAQLNPDLCSAEHFGQAQLVETQDAMGSAMGMIEGFLGGGGKKKKGDAPPAPGAGAGAAADDDIANIMAQAMTAGMSPGAMGEFARQEAKRERSRAERKKKGPITHKQPPLPPLTFDEFAWEGTDTLPAWAGFQARQGAYTSRSSARPSKGKVTVSVAPPGDADADPPPAPSPEQVAAYAFLKEHDADVAAAVLEAVFARYPELRENYGYDGEEAEEYMPDIKRPEELRKLIGLGIVHVLPVVKDGMAYVGFELGCTWDEEHGLGVMTHGRRVVDVGDASGAFEPHAPEDDGGENLADQ